VFLRELQTPITHIKGVGPAIARQLAGAGISSVAGLLSYYPRDWEDRAFRIPIAKFASQGRVNTEATVTDHEWFGYGAMKTLKIWVQDESARAALVCFNRPFMKDKLPEGARIRLWGQFHYKYGEIQSSAFDAELVLGDTQTPSKAGFGSIVPIYPLSGGLTQGTLRKAIKRAWTDYGGRLEDELPESIRARGSFMRKSDAIRAIHFPRTQDELSSARRTLIYEELFYLETIIGKRSQARRGEGSRRPAAQSTVPGGLTIISPLQNRLLERLPFKLTKGQTSALQELNADMERPYPMARLLQGDVGSGKTLVAFLACLRCVELGGQAAIMAPTELLARQHAENAAALLEPLGVSLAFLTGNIASAGRSNLLRALKEGNIDIVVGTHALFSKDVIYRSLRLVVVDEQHRFGVAQRASVMAKGEMPDLLMMSATPIPRTLALTVYGDLDVSVIPDMPLGRKPIVTHLARSGNEKKVYDFVRKELTAGRQAYFVYPLIEADESKGLKDAESMAARLDKEVFPEYSVAMVHSRLEEETKRKVMNAFRAGDIKVLVATSVVEVGVDVPNATCMVVEHAERFGLSALHQLRGRVGRDEQQSYCFLVFSQNLTEEGKARLKVMLETNDGFVVAEEDLKIRGPGQIAGIEQSGYLALGIADPLRDTALLAEARAEAFRMLEDDPGLLRAEHRVVAAVLERAPPFAAVSQ